MIPFRVRDVLLPSAHLAKIIPIQGWHANRIKRGFHWKMRTIVWPRIWHNNRVGRVVLLVVKLWNLLLDATIWLAAAGIPIGFLTSFRVEFCYLCRTTWRNCNCSLWNEARLIQDAQIRAPNNIQVQQRIMEHVRERECDHEWKRRDRYGGECENCSFLMSKYYYLCAHCRMSVCFTCRHHRIIN